MIDQVGRKMNMKAKVIKKAFRTVLPLFKQDLDENELRLQKAQKSLVTGVAWRPDYSKCKMKV